MTIMTSREFNQKTSLAQKYAQTAPVIITNRGKPAYVLVKYEDFKSEQKPFKNALEALCDLDHPDMDFEWTLPPRSKTQRPSVDFDDIGEE